MPDDSSKRSAQFHPASNSVRVLIFPLALSTHYPLTSVMELRSWIVVPLRKSYAEVPTLSTAKYDCIWRQGLHEEVKGKVKSHRWALSKVTGVLPRRYQDPGSQRGNHEMTQGEEDSTSQPRREASEDTGAWVWVTCVFFFVSPYYILYLLFCWPNIRESS